VERVVATLVSVPMLVHAMTVVTIQGLGSVWQENGMSVKVVVIEDMTSYQGNTIIAIMITHGLR